MSIRVLIADDSSFLRKKVAELLSSEESIEVIARAKNGKEAVKLTKETRPDVVILDLLMPNMNGLEAFKEIMDSLPLPVIILSSISPQTLDSSIQALLLGAFDYIIKPGTFGGEAIRKFQTILIDKVLIAAKSNIKTIYQNEKHKVDSTNMSIPFRQRRVNEIFSFGKYLNQLEKGSNKNSPNDSKVIKQLDEIQNFPEFGDIKKIGPVIDKSINSEDKLQPMKKDKNLKVNNTKKKRKDLKKASKKSITKSRDSIEKKDKIRGKSEKEFSYSEIKSIKQKNSTTLFSDSKPEALMNEDGDFELISKESSVEKLNESINTREEPAALNAFELLSKQTPPKTPIFINFKIIVIGASVGGPKTIKLILKDLPATFPYPIVIVQHLNPKFIEPFTRSLHNSCKLKVKVAEDKELLAPGTAYIAPGEKHLRISTINNKPCISTFEGPAINFCIPSIDVLFISASEIFKIKVIGILLTGMGEDGVQGLEFIKKNKGLAITESKDTAVLYGMPRLAIKRDAVNQVMPNYKIPKFLIKVGFSSYTQKF